jgi:putative SOS response-associated peptidase YedK
MCGRFTREYTWAQIYAMYSLIPGSPASNLQPRYNICPTTDIDVVVRGDDQRQLIPMRWGLIPGWWSKPLKEMRLATFNARSDTVASKPMFREAFKKRRCLIPASGYYEWQSIGKEKQPWYFTRNDGEPITIAGLHEAWNNPETGERTAAAPRASAPVFARAAGRPTQMDDVCWHFASFAARISLLRVSDAGRSR